MNSDSDFIKTVFVLFPLLGTSQNLVPNPSFEEHQTGITYTNYCSLYWFSPPDQLGSPDYFNEDWTTNGNFSVPNNFAGTQQAFGEGYQAIFCYATGGTDAREYLESQLLCPLIANQQYKVGFHISFRFAFAWQ